MAAIESKSPASRKLGDRLFAGTARAFAILTLLLLGGIMVSLTVA